MQLPALEPQERAYLQALQPAGALHAFASRLRQRLLASLGVSASVSVSPGIAMQGAAAGDEPVLAIAPELAAAWLALRLGGKPGAEDFPLKDAMLTDPLRFLIRRVLAESVVNAGAADWPQAIRLHVVMGGRQGVVDILWNSAHAMAWARRTIREKA